MSFRRTSQDKPGGEYPGIQAAWWLLPALKGLLAKRGDGGDEEDDKWWVWKLLEALWDLFTRFPEYVAKKPFPIPRISWPVLLPIGFDLPGEGQITQYVLTDGITKGAVRGFGRAVGDVVVPISVPIGLAISLIPSQIENVHEHAPWNEFVGDLLVDNVGFWVGEGAGKGLLLFPDEPFTGPMGLVVGPVIADVGTGAIYDVLVDKLGIRDAVVSFIGGPGGGSPIEMPLTPSATETPTPVPEGLAPCTPMPPMEPLPPPTPPSTPSFPTSTPEPGGS